MVINSEDYPVKEENLNKHSIFTEPQSFGLNSSGAFYFSFRVLETVELLKGKFGKTYLKNILKMRASMCQALLHGDLERPRNRFCREATLPCGCYTLPSGSSHNPGIVSDSSTNSDIRVI